MQEFIDAAERGRVSEIDANNGELLRDTALADLGIAMGPRWQIEEDLCNKQLNEVLGEFVPRTSRRSEMMWLDIVNPNWIRASSSAVGSNMIPLFQYRRQLRLERTLSERTG